MFFSFFFGLLDVWTRIKRKFDELQQLLLSYHLIRVRHMMDFSLLLNEKVGLISICCTMTFEFIYNGRASKFAD
jgi:hypothetical protein